MPVQSQSLSRASSAPRLGSKGANRIAQSSEEISSKGVISAFESKISTKLSSLKDEILKYREVQKHAMLELEEKQKIFGHYTDIESFLKTFLEQAQTERPAGLVRKIFSLLAPKSAGTRRAIELIEKLRENARIELNTKDITDALLVPAVEVLIEQNQSSLSVAKDDFEKSQKSFLHTQYYLRIIETQEDQLLGYLNSQDEYKSIINAAASEILTKLENEKLNKRLETVSEHLKVFAENLSADPEHMPVDKTRLDPTIFDENPQAELIGGSAPFLQLLYALSTDEQKQLLKLAKEGERIVSNNPNFDKVISAISRQSDDGLFYYFRTSIIDSLEGLQGLLQSA